MNRSNGSNQLLLSLDQIFDPRKEKLVRELRELVHHQPLDENKFQQRCLDYIDTLVDQFVNETRLFFKEAGVAWKQKLQVVRRELRAQRSLIARFKEEYRRVVERTAISPPSRKTVALYGFLYLVLMATSMGIFTNAFPTIFAEQVELIGLGWSLLLLTPSFFLGFKYRQLSTYGRERLVKCLGWIGFAASISFITTYYIARGFAPQMGGSGFTPQSLLGSGSTLSLFTSVSTLTLISSMITEVCFLGSLAIFFSSFFESHKPQESITNAITDIEEKVKNLETEEERLLGLIQNGLVNRHALRQWAEAKKNALYQHLESILVQERHDLLQYLSTLSTTELQTVVAITINGRRMQNGRTKFAAPKPVATNSRLWPH